ncbi:hypothetical protein PCANC_18535 [Puccinia coronata f. sp. avenae]|uniref:Uncharacterized protein n=1 Tax=Puccinia coronata f. sp. avenae TaxID=200324 RepID=A0A2N5SB55_9BASI|nr:hypothetical protein PCANC_18535 [Puccinia coronata f. sp. avenae]
MISTALFTAILLASATNALQSYNTQPQRQASYLSSQANHGQNNAPNAVVPASYPVAAAGPTYTRPGDNDAGHSRDAHGKKARRQLQQAGPAGKQDAAIPGRQDGGMASTSSSRWGGPAMPAGGVAPTNYSRPANHSQPANYSEPGGPAMPAGGVRMAQTNSSQLGGPAMPAGADNDAGHSRDAHGKMARRQLQQAGPAGKQDASIPGRQDGGMAPTNSSRWGSPAMPAGGVAPTNYSRPANHSQPANYSQPGGPAMPAGGVRMAQTNSSQSGGPAMPAGADNDAGHSSDAHGKIAQRQLQQAGPASKQDAAIPGPPDGGMAPTNSSRWGGPAMPAGGVAPTNYSQPTNHSQPGGPAMSVGAEYREASRANTSMTPPAEENAYGPSGLQHAAGLQARNDAFTGRQAGGVSQSGGPVTPAGVEHQEATHAHTSMASPAAPNAHGQSDHQHAAGLHTRTTASRCKIPKRCQSPRCNTPTSCNALHKYCAKKALRCRH